MTGVGGKQSSHPSRPAQLWQEVFPSSEEKLHLNHHCQVNPQGNPSWSEATHVLYPKPGAWPATSVQACTEQKPNSSYIFPPRSSRVGKKPLLTQDINRIYRAELLLKKKVGNTSSGILLSVFMSLGGVLSIQTRTVAFQDHLADLGQLWS